MESERREHDTFTMSRLSNVNFSSLLTTSKFARLKVFSLHGGLVSEVASKFFTTTLKKANLTRKVLGLFLFDH
tara:strand:+ start:734 stop:952 length:219 start_codon:yes stop_codon:yes gene_type:complete